MTLGIDAVLRAQGAGPSALRRSRVTAVAEAALREGQPLLQPDRASRWHAVERVTHHRVHLAGGGTLSAPLPVSQLAGARDVIAVVATVGAAIAEAVSRTASARPSLALALEGVAIAGLESWVASVRDDLRLAAAERGWSVTAPISPGMEGWPLAAGQRELFALLGDSGPVRRLEGGAMWPRHSLSFVVGIGPDCAAGTSPCDWCAARSRCRYRPPPGP